MPEYPIYDADGMKVQVGNQVTGTRAGTIQAPGAHPLSGQVQAIHTPHILVGWEWTSAVYSYERSRYELAGTCGTWERGFYDWGLRVVQPPAGGAHE
ncbi:MAG: hypothetical protein NT169_08875 [Chloroflexi bacterium]|nr:hypothetical protein [Chloroflexota bacterium]